MDTPLIIRVRFRSGAVSEERGNEAQCIQLMDDGVNGLIDYVQTLNPETGEFSLFVHDDDPAWSPEVIDRLFD